MTIEIRQLVIRAVAQAKPESGAVERGRTSEPVPSHSPFVEHEASASLRADEREALVATCVREVLRQLRKARER